MKLVNQESAKISHLIKLRKFERVMKLIILNGPNLNLLAKESLKSMVVRPESNQ